MQFIHKDHLYYYMFSEIWLCNLSTVEQQIFLPILPILSGIKWDH